MRYRAAEKLEIIRLVEQSSLPVRRALAPPRHSPRHVWNKLPPKVAAAVLALALQEPELSPRELATAFVDRRRYFVSEASV
jgi:putative transposase